MMVEAHPGEEIRSVEERLVIAADVLEVASRDLRDFAERVRVAGLDVSTPAIRDECDRVRAAIGQVRDHMLRLYMDVLAAEL